MHLLEDQGADFWIIFGLSEKVDVHLKSCAVVLNPVQKCKALVMSVKVCGYRKLCYLLSGDYLVEPGRDVMLRREHQY